MLNRGPCAGTGSARTATRLLSDQDLVRGGPGERRRATNAARLISGRKPAMCPTLHSAKNWESRGEKKKERKGSRAALTIAERRAASCFANLKWSRREKKKGKAGQWPGRPAPRFKSPRSIWLPAGAGQEGGKKALEDAFLRRRQGYRRLRMTHAPAGLRWSNASGRGREEGSEMTGVTAGRGGKTPAPPKGEKGKSRRQPQRGGSANSPI